MKRLLNLCIGAAVLVAFSGSSLLWAKAHVPLGQVQVCTPVPPPDGDDDDDDDDDDDGLDGLLGRVRNVSVRALERHLRGGACRLPACDFANIFRPNTLCSTEDVVDIANEGASDGFCDSVDFAMRDSAINRRATCTGTRF